MYISISISISMSISMSISISKFIYVSIHLRIISYFIIAYLDLEGGAPGPCRAPAPDRGAPGRGATRGYTYIYIYI